MSHFFWVALLYAATWQAAATIYLYEPFETERAFDQNWVSSTHYPDFARFITCTGRFYGDATLNRGLCVPRGGKSYAASTAFDPMTNEEMDLVVSVSVKFEQGPKYACGGGYIKLLPEMDPHEFFRGTEYWLMFGPEIFACDDSRRRQRRDDKVHIVINYNGRYVHWKKTVAPPLDSLTHVYTLVLRQDNTYALYIDKELRAEGSLEDDWKFLKPQMIADPRKTKPKNWVDEEMLDDPDDSKPADWDVRHPKTIPDPTAIQPPEWDNELDGEWLPPLIDNPDYAEWQPRKIVNPRYKGQWEAPLVPNPHYEEDELLYAAQIPIEFVGVELNQKYPGTVIDDIVIADDLDEVWEIVDETWGATRKREKEKYDSHEESLKPMKQVFEAPKDDSPIDPADTGERDDLL